MFTLFCLIADFILLCQDNEPEEGEIDDLQDGEIAEDAQCSDTEEYNDNVDPGDLNEEQLEIQREIILKKLQEEFNKQKDEEIVLVSSETDQSVIMVDSNSDEEPVARDNDATSQGSIKSEHLFKGVDDELRDENSEVAVIDVEAVVGELNGKDATDNGNSENPDESNQEKNSISHSNLETQETDTSPILKEIPNPLNEISIQSSADIRVEQENAESQNLDGLAREAINADSPSTCNPSFDLEQSETIQSDSNVMDHSSGDNLTIHSDELSAKGLPHRTKFAEGMTQFDAYYVETKSSGVFNKLRGLLKNSPIRQGKKS